MRFHNMKNQFWAWAVVWAELWNKRVWADYEQLLRPVFLSFYGQKINLNFVWKYFRGWAAKSLQPKILLSKVSPQEKTPSKMPTTKISMKLKSLLMNFKRVMAYYTKIMRAYLRGLLYIQAITIFLLDNNFGLTPFFKWTNWNNCFSS